MSFSNTRHDLEEGEGAAWENDLVVHCANIAYASYLYPLGTEFNNQSQSQSRALDISKQRT